VVAEFLLELRGEPSEDEPGVIVRIGTCHSTVSFYGVGIPTVFTT
jgi:hypothetical protein